MNLPLVSNKYILIGSPDFEVISKPHILDEEGIAELPVVLLGKGGHSSFHVRLSELGANLTDLKYLGFFNAFAATKPRH